MMSPGHIIDIASTGENETEKPWCAKGPNGFGVRLMLEDSRKFDRKELK